MDRLEEMSLAMLRQTAKERGLRGVSALRKQDLLRALQENEQEDREKRDRQDGRRNRAESNRREAGRNEPRRPDGMRRDGDRQEPRRPDGMRRDGDRQEPRRPDGMRRDGDRQELRRPDGMRRSGDRQDFRRPDGVRRDNQGWNTGTANDGRTTAEDLRRLDSGEMAHGILEVIPDGYGFIRNDNYLSGGDDIYVSPAQIRRFHMRTGDMIEGSIRVRTGTEKYAALLYVGSINGEPPAKAEHRRNFEDLTPIFPKERVHLERAGGSASMRIVDLLSPIGKGQRGMIVAPPKAGKTTLLKEIAKSVQENHPEMHIIILLIDERPEEVTDMKESIQGDNVEVIYSTFDELPNNHERVAEMVLGRAKRLVEYGHDVVILLDSITRLARAYNLTVAPSGRTLSGGLDPAALHMPKKFFGAARCMREGGSLTVLATALVDTGSRMDDVVFEEFKGTGNMELVLDRKLSEKRIFPAIDILKSGTRRDDLLLGEEEQDAVSVIRRMTGGSRPEDGLEEVLKIFAHSRDNREVIRTLAQSKKRGL